VGGRLGKEIDDLDWSDTRMLVRLSQIDGIHIRFQFPHLD